MLCVLGPTAANPGDREGFENAQALPVVSCVLSVQDKQCCVWQQPGECV